MSERGLIKEPVLLEHDMVMEVKVVDFGVHSEHLLHNSYFRYVSSAFIPSNNITTTTRHATSIKKALFRPCVLCMHFPVVKLPTFFLVTVSGFRTNRIKMFSS